MTPSVDSDGGVVSESPRPCPGLCRLVRRFLGPERRAGRLPAGEPRSGRARAGDAIETPDLRRIRGTGRSGLGCLPVRREKVEVALRLATGVGLDRVARGRAAAAGRATAKRTTGTQMKRCARKGFPSQSDGGHGAERGGGVAPASPRTRWRQAKTSAFPASRHESAQFRPYHDMSAYSYK